MLIFKINLYVVYNTTTLQQKYDTFYNQPTHVSKLLKFFAETREKSNISELVI